MANYPVKLKKIGWILSAAAGLSLAACSGAAARARQEQEQGQQGQQDERQQQQQGQQDGQQDQGPEPKARPSYTPQDADKPPYSRDGRCEMRKEEDQRAGTAEPTEARAVPEMLMVPAGTILLVRMNEFLSSDRNQIGDQFTAELEQPIVVNGWVVARRGQLVTGKVMAAQKAGRGTGSFEIGSGAYGLDGGRRPATADPDGVVEGSGGTTHGEDAATVAGGHGIWRAIGAAADWGKGAAIGAGAGAAAGIAAVLLTRGRPTILEPETQLSFRLVDPVRS